jgi:outer membrane protease
LTHLPIELNLRTFAAYFIKSLYSRQFDKKVIENLPQGDSMKISVANMASLIFVLTICGSAVGGTDIQASFGTERMFGHTTYHIKFINFIPEIGSDVKSDSELEFPLDMFLLSGSVELEGTLKSGEPWGVKLATSKNINHPNGYMKDSDWITVPGYNFNTQFSYTESDAQLNALLICLEGHLGLVRKVNLAVDLLGGYEYQDFSFEILGVRGWQGFNLSERVYFDAYPDTTVLDYDITYHIPYLGAFASFQVSPRVNLEARGIISPRARATDHDDHLLRLKTADSKCNGWALKGGVDLRWVIFGTPAQSDWFLGLGFGYTKISTKGSQTQTWYGDDPASPEIDDTGGKVTGINQKITSKQMIIRATISHGF